MRSELNRQRRPKAGEVVKPAYYNEFDKFAAQWLRNLIAAGHIAPGDVDDRSIEDVRPSDLDGYTQCHFFAGVGVWSYALRRAGWPDDRPVWTGSCPCQPFSEAGQGTGFDDERHLWPHFHHLIRERRPSVVLGEQVASKDAGPWIELVSADMEAMGYAFGAVPFPSAGVGAPHIRDRLYWVANTFGEQRARTTKGARARGRYVFGNGGSAIRLAYPEQHHSGRQAKSTDHGRPASHGSSNQHSGYSCPSMWLADTHNDEQRQGRAASGQSQSGNEPRIESSRCSPADGMELRSRTSQVNGFWADADWIFCRDGKWRPVEPGTQPLVDGTPTRVGRLRAYGNAINAEAARVFIECVM
ncbi:MAG: DNA cytosine methyltransferase [Gammaproteobacteria bacterium]|nr:DNA cytosine methyltransferase [Gammaproteobacteria bacterium]MBU1505128.1 DNA cytosine methyltransferase [Gammaproteobacteria bacterium]MBU2122002.1 DNA cytosine methyltransferase [Gammaproteobacteria bacterium]